MCVRTKSSGIYFAWFRNKSEAGWSLLSRRLMYETSFATRIFKFWAQYITLENLASGQSPDWVQYFKWQFEAQAQIFVRRLDKNLALSLELLLANAVELAKVGFCSPNNVIKWTVHSNSHPRAFGQYHWVRGTAQFYFLLSLFCVWPWCSAARIFFCVGKKGYSYTKHTRFYFTSFEKTTCSGFNLIIGDKIMSRFSMETISVCNGCPCTLTKLRSLRFSWPFRATEVCKLHGTPWPILFEITILNGES